MRDVFKEYKQGKISWDKAFCIANNKASLCNENTDYWADQMDSLGCEAAEQLVPELDFKQRHVHSCQFQRHG